jgi:hypothetical protein
MAVLAFAALSGPGCWALVPLFALRAVLDRSPGRALQCGLLLAGILIQFLFFADLGRDRTLRIEPALLGALVYSKHVLTPFLGPELAAERIARIAAAFKAGTHSLRPLAVVVVLFATAMVLFAREPRRPPFWFFLAAAVLAGAAYGGALHDKTDLIHPWSGARYAFAPQVLIGLALLSWTAVYHGRLRIVGGALVTWLLVIGAYNYAVPTSALFTTGPHWPAEVARWRNDPAYRPEIWPPGWYVTLSAK